MASYEQGNYIFNTNGVVIPDTASVQESVQNEYTEALGSDLSLEESTPQGRLIDVETTARINTLGFNATLANVIVNISMAAGPALDAWGANFGVPRKGATASQVTATVTGVVGTNITRGSQAQDTQGILWTAENDIVIGANNTNTGLFICSQTGPITLGIGELNTIVASGTLGIDGWETITNTSAAIVGSTEESDTSYRIRILQTIFTGSALFGNYQSAVNKVENVISSYAMDNPDSASLVLDDITIPGHSVYVCVQGGNSADVAYALYSVKSAGAGWAGNTTVVVTDATYGTQNTVKYQIPTDSSFTLDVDIRNDLNSSMSLSDEVKEVIIKYFAGEYDSFKKPGIRGIVNPFEIATVIKSQIDGITVNNIKVGLVTAKKHAVPTIIKASLVEGITWASVNSNTFSTGVSNNNGTYTFVYDGTNWKLNNANVTLNTYGITLTGTPISGDTIIVLYSNGNLSTYPIQIFASEVATISAENITVKVNS